LAGVPFESDGDWNYLPNLYYAQPVGQNGLSVGLGITTPYGQGISWNQSDFAPFALPTNTVPYDASIMMIDIKPTVAFRITDAVRLGVGLDIYYSVLELKAMQGFFAPPPAVVEGEGDGWGIGVNAGITWLTTEGQRLALTYRSGFEIDYSGDFKISGANAGDFETAIKYPNSVGVGYGVALSDRVEIEALIEWLQWSVNESQTINAGVLGTISAQNNWDDTFTFGFGGSWIAADWLVVRAGYAFIPSPIPDETITPLLPDADRHAISGGLGFVWGGHMLDVAYTYSIYSDRASVSGASPGIYEIDSNLIGLTYSYSF
jgi:long-chain fatty acid transport protein